MEEENRGVWIDQWAELLFRLADEERQESREAERGGTGAFYITMEL